MIWLGQPAQEPSWDHNGNWCWQKIPLNIFSNHWVYFSHILLYYAICMICQPVFIGSFCTGASLTIAMANLLEINIKIRGRNTNVNMINIVRGTNQPDGATCILIFSCQYYWHHQLVLSWYLHQPEPHQLRCWNAIYRLKA